MVLRQPFTVNGQPFLPMIDQLKQKLQQLSDTLAEQATNLGDSAKEKTFGLMEDWVQVFPKLEAYGLLITSFGLSMGLSPALEVEMRGQITNFSEEKLNAILADNKDNRPITSVFKAIQMTVDLHNKIGATCPDPLLVKVKVKIPPEVQVFLGTTVIL